MEEAWSVPDVYLLAEGRGDAVAVPNLSLTFGDLGLALDKADGEPVWSSNWVDLEELSAVERSVLPDGRDGVVIVVVERGGGRRHRFVLASNDVVTTEAAIRDRAGAHGVRTRSGRTRGLAAPDRLRGCGGAGHPGGAAPVSRARHPLLRRATSSGE